MPTKQVRYLIKLVGENTLVICRLLQGVFHDIHSDNTYKISEVDKVKLLDLGD